MPERDTFRLQWLHGERMNTSAWFVEVAGLRLWVEVGKDGKGRVLHEERD